MADLNAGRLDLPRSGKRLTAFVVAASVIFAVLGARLFQLQVMDGEGYAARAAAARSVEVAIRAARGLVFDRAGRAVAANVPSWTVKVRPADLPEEDRGRVLRRVAELTGAELATIRARVEAYRGSPHDLVPVARGVDREVALLLGEEGEALPGVVVEVEAIREYLDETGAANGALLSHLLGYSGPIDGGELERLAGAGYLRDDVIGKAGIEASYEDALRGHYGSQLVERDASGRLGKVVRLLEEPVPGTNLMLTIDGRTQRLAEQALRWGIELANVSQGVTIVMNPQTGEILAMVSLPAYDNNKFARGISAADYQVYLDDANRPLPGESDGELIDLLADERSGPAEIDLAEQAGHGRALHLLHHSLHLVHRASARPHHAAHAWPHPGAGAHLRQHGSRHHGQHRHRSHHGLHDEPHAAVAHRRGHDHSRTPPQGIGG